MMRSLSSAVAGLRSHQTKMDVIGNNIANVNTYGFKASRTTFADVYYQNLSTGSAGGANSGGTNPTQIGYGASVATVDVINTQSGSASTDRALDVYITGDGFLVSRDPGGKFQYTRLGNLGFDASGNLIDGNGQLVQGFPLNPDGTPKISADGTILPDQLQAIKVDKEILDKLTSISISSSGAIVGQLPGDTELKANSGIATWLNSLKLSLPPDSSYQGTVTLAISGFCRKEDMASALGLQDSDIMSMEMGTIALPQGSDYKLSVDNTGLVTLTRPATYTESAVNLTGAIKNGKITLIDNSGNVGMTINLDTTKEISLSPTTEKIDVYSAKTTAGTMIGNGGGDVSMVTATKVNTAVSMAPSGGFVEYYVYDASNPPTNVRRETDGTNDLDVKTTTTNTGIKLYNSDGTPKMDGTKQLYADIVADIPSDPHVDGKSIVPHYPDPADLTKIEYAVPTVFDTGRPIMSDDGKTQLRDASGAPLYMQILDNAGNEMALQYDATGRQVTVGDPPIKMYVTILPIDPVNPDTPASNTPLRGPGGAIVVPNRYVADEVTGQVDEIVGRNFNLDLYQQLTTTDKGGNTVKEPAMPQIYSTPATWPQSITFGDITLELLSMPSAFNGVIGTASAAEGERITIGNLVLAKFRNPGGLQQSGTSYFDETFNSGSAIFLLPGVEGTGGLKAGYLEMSNVDVSKEFTDMITTQRGFQANTRIITVSDEMLQELVNLKR